MTIVTVDPKDVRVTIGGVDLSNSVDQTGIVVVSGATGRVMFSATGDHGERLVNAVRRRFMTARGYAMAPQRKRPRRVAKKIRARFGVAHHRDYHRELVRWINEHHDDAPRSVAL